MKGWIGLGVGLIIGFACAPTTSRAAGQLAPVDATYLTQTANPTLTHEVVVPIGYVNGSVTIGGSRPLAFPNVAPDGFVHFFKLGGTTENDIFLSGLEGGPGYDEHTEMRTEVIWGRPATVTNPLSGVALVLSGWYHNGSALAQRAMEIDNVVRPSGNPEMWWQEIRDGGGYPYARAFRRPGTISSGVIASHDQPGDSLCFQGVDNALGYSDVACIKSADQPYWDFPAGVHVAGMAGYTGSVCTHWTGGICDQGAP